MKEMAKLLRQGARMLGDTCPECGTPIFQLKTGEIICPMCQRPVKFIDKDQDLKEIEEREGLELTLSKKIIYVQNLLDKEKNIEKIKEITETLELLLKVKNLINS
jgi:UPF0148 protein